MSAHLATLERPVMVSNRRWLKAVAFTVGLAAAVGARLLVAVVLK